MAKPKPAENVLLRTLGLVPDDMVADKEAICELKKLFDSPLREQHVRVIAALFGKTMPPAEELARGGDTAVTVV